MLTAPTTNETVPEFLTVTFEVWDWPTRTRPKSSELTVNVEPVPVPRNWMVVSPPAALCGMVSVAFRAPVAVGLNCTPIWQD